MVKVPNSTSSSVSVRFTHLDVGSQLHHRTNHSQWTQAPLARTVFLSAQEISSLVLQLWGTYMAGKSQDFLQLAHKPGLTCVSTCAALPSAFCVPALPPGGPGPHHPLMLPHTEILPVFIFFPNTQTSYGKLAGTSRLQAAGYMQPRKAMNADLHSFKLTEDTTQFFFLKLDSALHKYELCQ